MRRRRSNGRMAGATLALVLLVAGPAAAHHKSDHSTGSAQAGAPAKQTRGGVTEDNDSDGVRNNIRDAGDNRHPSRKDRSVEHGRSGDQGRSASTPDQDGRGPERDVGGIDQPDGPGGRDIIDQDRNNGCGNDDDFDDDNEGRCLGPLRTRPSDLRVEDALDDEEVLDEVIRRPTRGGPVVRGLVITRAAPPAHPRIGALAGTGAPAGTLGVLALALLAGGAALRRSGRREI